MNRPGRDARVGDMLVVGNYPPDRQLSMARYAEDLVRGLREQGVAADLIRPEPRAGRLARGGAAAKWLGYLDKFVLFPPRLRRRARSYKLVHIADHSNSPYRAHVGGRPVLITCHDLFAVRAMLGEMGMVRPSRTGVYLQHWILASLRRFESIICVSATTAADVRRLAPEVARVTLIPNAISPEFTPMPAEEADPRVASLGLDPATGFLLHVGGNKFYKNRPGVVYLFDAIAARRPGEDLRLVLAGQQPDVALAAALERSAHRDRIDLVVDATDADVRALYARARMLLFPSFHEGFGWPILEAQACGCPVATSDREPMRGIAGGAAVLFDPQDPAAAAIRVAAALGRTGELRTQGLVNVEQYRLAKITARYAELYRTIADFRNAFSQSTPGRQAFVNREH